MSFAYFPKEISCLGGLGKSLSFLLGIDTAAVILPVKAVLSRKLYRPLISVLFLKIRRQISNPVLPGQLLSDLIELACIL